jgi:hypothetical protein
MKHCPFNNHRTQRKVYVDIYTRRPAVPVQCMPSQSYMVQYWQGVIRIFQSRKHLGPEQCWPGQATAGSLCLDVPAWERKASTVL